MNKLIEYRAQIDEIDSQMLRLFQKRMDLAHGIAAYKRENALPIEDLQREQTMIAAKLKNTSDPILKKEEEALLHYLAKLSKARQRQYLNLYLIGMPYSGKSTVLKQLASSTKRQTVDTDELIEKACGKSISEIFDKYGESQFRNMESEVLKQVVSSGSLIVATGGGILTREKNAAIIANSGYCVLIDRSLERIISQYEKESKHNRPLIQCTEDIEILYFERFKQYRNCAHLAVDPDRAGCTEKILEFMKEHDLQ